MANGKTYTQPLTVAMDPRVKTSAADLQQQFALSKEMYDGVVTVNTAVEQLHALRPTLTKELGAKAAEIEGEVSEGFAYSFPRPIGAEKETLNSISHSMLSLMNIIQSADVAPTDQLVAAVADRRRVLDEVLARFQTFRSGLPKTK